MSSYAKLLLINMKKTSSIQWQRRRATVRLRAPERLRHRERISSLNHIHKAPVDRLDEVNYACSVQVPDLSITFGTTSTPLVTSACLSCFDASVADPARAACLNVIDSVNVFLQLAATAHDQGTRVTPSSRLPLFY